ncbi:MAG: NAD-dependent deacylase [Burkholderiales bacterium]
MDSMEAAARALRGARYVAVLTGAGVSAESGVPTFRDAQQGLWARYDPHDLATPEAFARNPRLVWDWYAARREMIRRVEPNPAHRALAAMEDLVPAFLLATQNVDGLHARAGSRRLVELHGNILRVRCSSCGIHAATWDDASPPRCDACGAYLRPDVVWFNEMLPAEAQSAATDAAVRCDVYLVAGTSAEVYPAAALPRAALDHGACVIEVNPDATPLSASATHVLRGKAGEVLPRLLRAAFGERS